jgi:hypothetical protein
VVSARAGPCKEFYVASLATGMGRKLQCRTEQRRVTTRHATKRKKGALRFSLAAPMVAGVRLELTTFGL